MRDIKEILSTCLTIFVLSTFLVSTTGFTAFKHTCSHHQAEQVIIIDKDNCCEEETDSSESENCCQTNHCDSSNEHDYCCTVEITYLRLSDLFVSVDIDKNQPVCKAVIVKTVLQHHPVESDLTSINQLLDDKLKPVAKQPKYILYSQAKFAPPLILS